jgi:L-ascorbate metabolism protein UlaG (beta-lactamase superfamily)
VIAPSDHFDGTRFFNPTGANGVPVSKVPRMLLSKRTRWPARVPIVQQRPPALTSPDDVVITFIGHSTFLIQTSHGNVLTDPVYAERAGPFGILGPRRARAPGVAFADLPPVAVVLLSHNHYDHCDRGALRALERAWSPTFVTPLGNGPLLRRSGASRVHELDWWESAGGLPFGVTLTPAQHFSARTPFDRNRALWGGFVVSVRKRRIYFAGDTGYAPHFGSVRDRTEPIDVALLPIGAYEPRWFMKDIHMNPAESVQAHLDLGSRLSIASHFGTFQLTPEGIDDPPAALAEALRTRDVPGDRFRVLDVGESLRV